MALAQHPAAPRPRVESVSGLAAVRDLRGEWDALAAATPDATIFQTWEWTISWYEHLADGDVPLVLTVRDEDGTLAGLAPCALHRAGRWGPRLLYLLGRGNSLTEYVDALVRPDRADTAADLLAGALCEGGGSWDLLILPSIPAEGPLARAVHRRMPPGRWRYHVVHQDAVRRALPARWEDFTASLSRNTRKHLKKFANRLEREGHKARLVTLGGGAAPEEALAVLFDLHRRRALADLGVTHKDRFASPERRAFLTAVARRFAERGWLAPLALEIAGRPVAAQLCFMRAGVFYPAYSGYDPEWAWHGVMLTMFRHAIGYAIDQGCSTLDLGLGLNQEKARWGGRPEPITSVVVARPGLRGRAVFGAYLALRAARHRRATPADHDAADDGD